MAKIKQTEIQEKYLWMGGGLLALVIIIFVFGRVSADDGNDDPSDENPNINPITVSTDSGNIDWNPSATVKKVHTAFAVNWYSGRCTVMNELASLQDVQLKAVAEGYKAVYGKTLRKVITEAYVWCDPFDAHPQAGVIKRLDVLQIA